MVCVFVTAQTTNSSYIISMTNGRIIIRRLTVKIFQILWVINDIYDYCLWIRYIALGYDTMRCYAMLATASLCSNRFYVLICVCRRVQQNPYFWSPNFERFRRENNDKSTFWLVFKKMPLNYKKPPCIPFQRYFDSSVPLELVFIQNVKYNKIHWLYFVKFFSRKTGQKKWAIISRGLWWL